MPSHFELPPGMVWGIDPKPKQGAPKLGRCSFQSEAHIQTEFYSTGPLSRRASDAACHIRSSSSVIQHLTLLMAQTSTHARKCQQ